MNKLIVDVQGQADARDIPIAKVGIKGVAFRGSINFDGEKTVIQGKSNCYVFLEAEKKGTHMSRMTRGISKLIDNEVSFTNLKETCEKLYSNLETSHLYFEIEGEVVRKKLSPITSLVGYESFNLNIDAEIKDGKFNATAKLEIIGTSLCPASKTNSKYGAHNQRSKVCVAIPFSEGVDIKKYLDAIEDSLSARVYPILKLDDEAFVTEKAYENPRFVEDIVRDTSNNLSKLNLEFSVIDCENFESIHTHNAYAIIHNIKS
jgi:GTP cyclohydrolase IB